MREKYSQTLEYLIVRRVDIALVLLLLLLMVVEVRGWLHRGRLKMLNIKNFLHPPTRLCIEEP